MAWMSTTQLAKKHGVSSQTIRRNVEAGLYEKVEKLPSGHYRIFVPEGVVIGYVRVSSAKQKSSLAKQEALIRDAYPDAAIISDIASSFNFHRKGLQHLLERAVRGDVIHVVVASQDRLARSGFELIRHLIELSGGQVTTLDDAPDPAEPFDTNTLVGFITSFCNSYYGKRSAKRRRKSH